ncbi:MAG: hypothetical protein AAF497_13495, partial [Planctomycetota bacterium]
NQGLCAATNGVQAGEHVDFVTDCRSEESFDSFYWPVSVRTADSSSDRTQWDSRKDFHGPLPRPMTKWARYAQSLLLTNEFMFVD